VARASEVISGGNIFASFFRSVGYTRKQVLPSAPRDRHPVSTGDYDAWLFDLDGVLTDTASVHAAAWKRTFDGYLEELAARQGSAFEPFEIDSDSYCYVDGKPRYDGVDSFFRSRGFVLEWGDPGDPPERETVCRIRNCKNAAFNEVLRTRGVQIFASSVALVRELGDRGERTAVVTSSKNWTRCWKRPACGISSMLE
jgi:trehalose 6-phosphate phosphatase